MYQSGALRGSELVPSTIYTVRLRRTFFGIHCPARILKHDPMQMQGRADMMTPLQSSTVFVFRTSDEANFFAQLLYTHRSLSGKWPSRELVLDDADRSMAAEPWQWAKEVMLRAPDMSQGAESSETHGLEVYATEAGTLVDLAAVAHVQIAIVELNSLDPFNPPQGYSVTPWIVPLKDPKPFLEKNLTL